MNAQVLRCEPPISSKIVALPRTPAMIPASTNAPKRLRRLRIFILPLSVGRYGHSRHPRGPPIGATELLVITHPFSESLAILESINFKRLTSLCPPEVCLAEDRSPSAAAIYFT